MAEQGSLAITSLTAILLGVLGALLVVVGGVSAALTRQNRRRNLQLRKQLIAIPHSSSQDMGNGHASVHHHHAATVVADKPVVR